MSCNKQGLTLSSPCERRRVLANSINSSRHGDWNTLNVMMSVRNTFETIIEGDQEKEKQRICANEKELK